MGIFNWMFGEKSNVEILADMIWLTKRAKFTGIATSVTQRLSASDRPLAVILVAHFQDCLNELQQILENGHFDCSVTAVAAGDLKSARAPTQLLDESRFIDIVVGERHPLSSHDDAVVAFARDLSCQCRIVYHVSLEDPLMKIFAGEWVHNFLKQIGMKDDEAIESSMVARRFKQARQKIESRASGDEPADSAEEWLARNIPN